MRPALIGLALFASTVVGLAACDRDHGAAPSPAPVAAATTSPAAPAPAQPAAAAPTPPAPAPDQRVEATMEGHIPASLAESVTRPQGARALVVGGLVHLDAPPSVTLASRRPRMAAGGSGLDAGIWTPLSGLSPAVSLYQHNPAGDSGADCPSLETIRGRIGDAQILTSRRLAAPWSGEGPACGDEIDVLVFQRGDQAGFFVRKRFDHGDDYTDLCAAFGDRSTPFAMTSLGTLEQARAAAGIVLTARENL